MTFLEELKQFTVLNNRIPRGKDASPSLVLDGTLSKGFLLIGVNQMAVYRQIQTSFWQDDFVLSLTPEEKYFYIYLFTNSKTKQCGIYELPLQVSIMETGYNRETIIKLLQRFIELGKINYDWETKEISIKNWMKHNPAVNPLIQKCIKKELSQIKNESLIDKSKYPFIWVSQKEKEEEQKEEKEQEEIDHIWQTSFGRNPKLPERELTLKHLRKFGFEKTKNIYKQAVLSGFQKVKTLDESLTEDGSIKSKGQADQNKPLTYAELINLPGEEQTKYMRLEDGTWVKK